MKKLAFVAAAALCSAVFADEITSGIVGYTTIDAPAAGKYMALSIQFEDVTSANTLAISSLVAVAAPKGAASAITTADQLWVWDSATSDWVKYFYRSTNKVWCKRGTTTQTTDTVSTGDTVFFYRGMGGSATTVTLSGGVKQFTAQMQYTGLTAGKYKFIGYPWPVDMPIASFTNYQGAPKGAASAITTADQIWLWDTSASDWVKYFYRSTNKVWCKRGTTTETTDVVPAGSGFFYYRGMGGAAETITFTYGN